jgi:hypothetical protein
VVYAKALYAYDGQPISNCNVSYAGLYALTNSTGWAKFSIPSSASVAWHSIAYGVSEPTYGLTYRHTDQVIAYEKENVGPFYICSRNEITNATWNDVNKKLSFTTSGTIKVKVGDYGQPLRVEVDGAVYTDWSYDSVRHEVTVNNLASNVVFAWQTEQGGVSGGVSGGAPSGGTTTPPPITVPSVSIPPEASPFVNLGLIIIVAVIIGLWAQKQFGPKRDSAKGVSTKWTKTRQKQKGGAEYHEAWKKKKKSRFYRGEKL